MGLTVMEIEEWLRGCDPEEEVGIDEGGLCLQVVGEPEFYLEIGGIPEEESIEDYGEKTCMACKTVFSGTHCPHCG